MKTSLCASGKGLFVKTSVCTGYKGGCLSLKTSVCADDKGGSL